MPKPTREEKREEERRILAEMDEAMAAKSKTEEGEQPQKATVKKSANQGKKGKTYYCPTCKVPLDEKGLCSRCGNKTYIPMDEEKRNKIKLILTAVFLVIFAVLFVWLQFKK